MTPDQLQQIKTWAEERDGYMKEISELRSSKSELKKECDDLSNSKTLLENKSNELIGAIVVLEAEEEKRIGLISKKLAQLKEEQTSLQTIVKSLRENVEDLTNRKDELEKSIPVLLSVESRLKEQSEGLKGTIDYVVKTSNRHTEEVSMFLTNLKRDISTMQSHVDEMVKDMSGKTAEQFGEMLKDFSNKLKQ